MSTKFDYTGHRNPQPHVATRQGVHKSWEAAKATQWGGQFFRNAVSVSNSTRDNKVTKDAATIRGPWATQVSKRRSASVGGSQYHLDPSYGPEHPSQNAYHQMLDASTLRPEIAEVMCHNPPGVDRSANNAPVHTSIRTYHGQVMHTTEEVHERPKFTATSQRYHIDRWRAMSQVPLGVDVNASNVLMNQSNKQSKKLVAGRQRQQWHALRRARQQAVEEKLHQRGVGHEQQQPGPITSRTAGTARARSSSVGARPWR